MLKPVKRDSKKPYSAPKLCVYGRVRDLTQKKGLRKTSDGGSFPKIKTHI
jgi:hypothetical protein